ncbi:MAG: hypothetical protein AAF799_16960 [Myxococcota bacterium]
MTKGRAKAWTRGASVLACVLGVGCIVEYVPVEPRPPEPRRAEQRPSEPSPEIRIVDIEPGATTLMLCSAVARGEGVAEALAGADPNRPCPIGRLPRRESDDPTMADGDVIGLLLISLLLPPIGLYALEQRNKERRQRRDAPLRSLYLSRPETLPPLFLALLRIDTDAMKLLLDAGADPNIRFPIEGNPPAVEVAFDIAVVDGVEEPLWVLLDAGAGVTKADLKGRALLDSEADADWLVERSELLRRMLERGLSTWSGFMRLALGMENLDSVEVLLEFGADPEWNLLQGEQSLEFARMLLEYGADPMYADAEGLNAFEYTLGRSVPYDKERVTETLIELLRHTRSLPKDYRRHLIARARRAGLGQRAIRALRLATEPYGDRPAWLRVQGDTPPPPPREPVALQRRITDESRIWFGDIYGSTRLAMGPTFELQPFATRFDLELGGGAPLLFEMQYRSPSLWVWPEISYGHTTGTQARNVGVMGVGVGLGDDEGDFVVTYRPRFQAGTRGSARSLGFRHGFALHVFQFAGGAEVFHQVEFHRSTVGHSFGLLFNLSPFSWGINRLAH